MREGEEAPTSTPSVLVVDDNGANRLLMLRQLERLGYQADAVDDGGEALRALARGSYALVLMDCQMPGLDGFGATQAVRRREAAVGGRVPIVGVTASVSEADLRRCLSAGMDEVLTKPFMIGDLADVLARRLRRSPGVRSPHDDAHDPGAPSINLHGIDRAVLERLGKDLGGEALERFVTVYLEELSERCASIRRAVSAQDPSAASAGAHVLRAPSASVGAIRLAGLCGEVEAAALRGALDAALVDSIERESALVATDLRMR